MDPDQAIRLCRTAHARLRATAERISEEQVRSPSRLPGWTIAHVLTHLARNADGHVRRLEGALRGENAPRYPGGSAQRIDEINEGALRPAADIVAGLDTSQRRLELVWDHSVAAGWPHADPSRVHRPEDLRALVAWLSGRRPIPSAIQLDPW
jgi:maleylpyruvate isomerase